MRKSVKSKAVPISEQLRTAIKKSGVTQYQIAKLTRGKVSRFSLSRFLGGGGLRLEGVDALGQVVGFRGTGGSLGQR